MEQLRRVEQLPGQPQPQVEGQRPVLERRDIEPRHPLDRPGVAGERRPLQLVVAEVAGVGPEQPGAEEGEGEHRDECPLVGRSEEHTSELQSLMRISYAVFCLKKKKKTYDESPNKT